MYLTNMYLLLEIGNLIDFLLHLYFFTMHLPSLCLSYMLVFLHDNKTRQLLFLFFPIKRHRLPRLSFYVRTLGVEPPPLFLIWLIIKEHRSWPISPSLCSYFELLTLAFFFSVQICVVSFSHF